MPNGKGVWANNFNHYYIGDVNNNLQSLANYSEIGVKFIRYDYSTTFTLNQSVRAYQCHASQLLNNVDNVFSISLYVDVSTQLSTNPDGTTYCKGMFFVPSNTTYYTDYWNTLNYSPNSTKRLILSCSYFNDGHNIYTCTYHNESNSYQWWTSSTNIFNNPILSVLCTRNCTLNLTANIKYTILAFA